MAKNLEFRKFRRGDEEGFSSLFREVFHVEKDASYWDWKYFRNPAGQHMIIIALDKDKIVGATGTIPARFKVGAKEIIAAQGVDIVLLPQYRDRGTFFKIEKIARKECQDNNVKFNYAATIKKTYRIFTKMLGFVGVCPLFNMTKVLNPAPYLQQKIKTKLLSVPIGFMAKKALSVWYRKKPLMPHGLSIKKVTRFDHRFDEFWSRESHNYEIAVVKDSSYLNWRYVDAPESYDIFGAEQDGVIKGFVVLKCSREEVVRGRIMDIFVEKGREDIAEILLTRAIQYFVDKDADVITCWMLEQWPIIEALRKRGFVKRETPHDLVIRSFATDIPNEYLTDKSKWYLTMGDSDYY